MKSFGEFYGTQIILGEEPEAFFGQPGRGGSTSHPAWIRYHQRDGNYKQRAYLQGFCHYPHREVHAGCHGCKVPGNFYGPAYVAWRAGTLAD
jgi:hypothetical protein